MSQEESFLTTGIPHEAGSCQPHATGPEKSILSSMLQNPREYIAVAAESGLTKEAFYFHAHATLFAHLSDLHASNKPIELVSLVQGMIDKGILDHVGGPAAVTDLFTYAPTHAHFQHHLQMVQDKHLLRSLISVCREGIEEAFAEPGDAEALLGETERKLANIRQCVESQQDQKSEKEILLERFEAFKARLEGRLSPMGVPTGINELDGALRGLRPKRVWVIGAYPSGGKSLIGGQILTNAAMLGHPSGIISLEMPVDEMLDRIVIQHSKQPALAYTDPEEFKRGGGVISAHMLSRFMRTANDIKEAPLFLRRIKGNKIDSVIAAIRRLHREKGIKFVAIDHLQRITAKRQTGDSKEQEVQAISHAFQNIADELNLHVVVLSQLNAEGDTKHGKVIEEDADAFLMVRQDMNKDSDDFKKHLGLQIVKDRHYSQGGTMLPVLLNRETLRFEFGLPPKKEQATRFSR